MNWKSKPHIGPNLTLWPGSRELQQAWLKMARPGGPTQLTRDRRRPDARAMVKRFDGDLGGPT
jgi:hypothetical protein